MAKKKRSTRSRLVDRAARGEGGRPEAQGKPSRSADTVSLSLGGLQIPGLQLDEVQETVRAVVGYVQQNPVAAAAVALGAGVALTSMYWDGMLTGTGGRKR